MYGTSEYFLWSELINRRYCERHGYDYVIRRDQPRGDRHINWHRVQMIREELHDCDYLMSVDADAVFYSHELTIENELLPEFRNGKLIVMAQDCGSEANRWNPGLPNAGVILMKNEERTKEIISEWDGLSETDTETRWQWPLEQLAFGRHILPKFKDDVYLLDYYVLQGYFGQFIRHYYLSSDEVRTNAMKAIYKRLSAPASLDHAATKSAIKVVQYHWGDQNRSCEVSRGINETYCRRHGYEYVLKTLPPKDDRSPHWEKIPAMREELYNCDFLLYLDADAFFYSQELTIEGELLSHLEGKQIMMSTDCAHEGLRSQPDKPNSGAILIRNTDKAAEMLCVWDESSERPAMEELRFHPFGEQEACFHTIWQQYTEEVKLLKDYYLMNGTFGVFIRHLMGMNDEDRSRIQTTFLENRRDVIQI